MVKGMVIIINIVVMVVIVVMMIVMVITVMMTRFIYFHWLWSQNCSMHFIHI